MHLTSWLACDGYFETFASFTSNVAPCLIVRVVKEGNGKYRPCLRSHPSGIMIANGSHSDPDPERAKMLAKDLLRDFLELKREEIMRR